MPWHAKPGCAKHHVAALERLVNSFLPGWLLPPNTGEIFASKGGPCVAEITLCRNAIMGLLSLAINITPITYYYHDF